MAKVGTPEILIEPVSPVPYAELGSLTLDGALRPIELHDNAAMNLPGSTSVDWTPSLRGGLDVEED